jgi:hypothetical protein
MENKVKFYTRRKNFFSSRLFGEYLEIKDVNYEDALKLAEILKKYGFMIKVNDKEI